MCSMQREQFHCVLQHQVALFFSCLGRHPFRHSSAFNLNMRSLIYQFFPLSRDVELEGHKRNMSRNVNRFHPTCMQMFTELTQLHQTSLFGLC